MGQPQPLFNLFSLFQTHITILTANKSVKMSIQYTVLGFELTTFGTGLPPRKNDIVVSHNDAHIQKNCFIIPSLQI